MRRKYAKFEAQKQYYEMNTRLALIEKIARHLTPYQDLTHYMLGKEDWGKPAGPWHTLLLQESNICRTFSF